MNLDIYEFQEYRAYLRQVIKSKRQRGFRSRLSEAIQCQGAFISQVLGGKNHFNLEHGQKINQFLSHTKEECHYFLLLILYARAATEDLRAYFREQIDFVLEQRLVLKNRFKVQETLSKEDRALYYSAWYYGAIRILLTIPEFQTKEMISQRLQVPPNKVSEVLDFLCTRQLAEQKGNKFYSTQLDMHLGVDSPWLSKHHSNWRLQALKSLDRYAHHDLHYSSVVTVSRQDAKKLKSMLIKNLEECREVIRPSPAEEAFCFNIDFFEL